MNYNIWDKFMIRIPVLPYSYYRKYNNSKLDIYNFIASDEFLNNYFKKALPVSSYSLYKSYINVPTDKKKYRNFCSGLLKYFIRATCRPVPFGYYASVSIGEFGDRTVIEKKEAIIDISPDTNWINGLVRKLEDNVEYTKKLKVRFNNICYISGDRLKNPFFSNRGNLEKSDEKINENSIRNTKLIDLIRGNTKNFIEYETLFEIIKKEYEGVQESTIHKTMYDLIQNEYLLTNLRLPAYCDDALQHIIDVVEKINELKDITVTLKNLQEQFIEYAQNKGYETVDEIINTMKKLYTCDDYIELNTGFTCDNRTLDYSIKRKIEKFIDTLSDISLEISTYATVEKIKDKFAEEYGSSVEVDLTEIIDGNGFNACSYMEVGYKSSQREKYIQEIINNKIIKAIIDNECVKLIKEDFSNVKNEEINNSKGFDINFYITKRDEEYNLIVGPNAGASKQGNMFQRFKNAFVKDDFESYNKIYSKVEESNEEDVIFAELRECVVSGRTLNVVNNTKNYKYYLAIAMAENEEYPILLDDIVLGLNGKNRFYFRSKSLNKEVVFVKDNMLNSNLNSKLFQLLYEISSSNYDLPLNRVFASGKDMTFIPRIYLEDAIIKLKQWKFNDVTLRSENIDIFKKGLKQLCDDFKVDEWVYLVDGDNRLVINLKDDQYINLVYETFKKQREIKFTELEPNLFDGCLVSDDKRNKYVNEFVFSCYLDNKHNKNEDNRSINKIDLKLKNEDRTYLPFQDGWIYLKLYGLANRTDEFLKKELKKVEEFGAVRWFFIRYSDSDGAHIRIRIKFEDDTKAILSYSKISDWLYSLKSMKMFDFMQLDTYKREINRYGGIDVINLFEEYSQLSSICVIDTLNNFDLGEKRDDIYFFQTLMIYLNTTESLEDLLNLIDNEKLRKAYKKEFKLKRNDLIEVAEKYISGDFGEFEPLRNSIENMDKILKKYSIKIDDDSYNNLLTNSKSNIIGALAHMHCNRLTGDRELEYMTLSMIRHTIFAISEKRKHYKGKADNSGH